MYDLIIIGGGPAGLTAAIYALHRRLETLLISQDLGGKANYHLQLEGYEGHEAIITGTGVVEKFKRRLEYLRFANRIDRVNRIEPNNGTFGVWLESGDGLEARAVVAATGATPLRVDIPGEKRLIGRGLSYSALSHAQLFIEKEAALFGGSGRALRAAMELANVARQVHLLLPDTSEMESPLGKKLRTLPNVMVYEEVELTEIRGERFVDSVIFQSRGTLREIRVDGLFIELGLLPNSQLVADLGVTDSQGRIRVDGKCATSYPGLFAAGDVTDVFIEQILISIGEGAKAALSGYEYLLTR